MTTSDMVSCVRCHGSFSPDLANSAGLTVEYDNVEGWICPACTAAEPGRKARCLLKSMVLAVEAQQLSNMNSALRAALGAARDYLKS